MAIYMRIREPGQISEVLKFWRISAWVGLAGMLGSGGGFTAMTLQNAAYVRALGQIELLFTFAASHLFFCERSKPAELMGMLWSWEDSWSSCCSADGLHCAPG